MVVIGTLADQSTYAARPVHKPNSPYLVENYKGMYYRSFINLLTVVSINFILSTLIEQQIFLDTTLLPDNKPELPTDCYHEIILKW